MFERVHKSFVHVNRRLPALSSHFVELEGRSFRALEEYVHVLARCILPRMYQPLVARVSVSVSRTGRASMRASRLRTLRKGQLNRHTRYRPATTTRETLPRSGRVARWTNTPARIFKDPAPTPVPATLHLSAPGRIARPIVHVTGLPCPPRKKNQRQGHTVRCWRGCAQWCPPLLKCSLELCVFSCWKHNLSPAKSV